MEKEISIDGMICSYLEGSASEQELKTLLQWIRERKENLRYFNELCNIWENSSDISGKCDETELALNKLDSRIKLFEKEAATVELIAEEDSKRIMIYRVAAIAILLTGFSILFYIAFNKVHTKNIRQEYVTAIAPKSQKSQLILADGTKVWLNSGTTVKYKTDYGKSDRQIILNGEAYFEVAKNPSRPFLVYAGNIVVKAIGTSFNIKCYPDDNIIETTLVEGKVQVSSHSGDIRRDVYLLPKQCAIFNRTDNRLVIAPNSESGPKKKEKENLLLKYRPKSIEAVISWKNEELMFENESFDELTKRLERWYNIDITVIHPEVILKNRYTGKFVHNESLEQVLKIIARTTPIKYTIKDGEVLIESKN